MGFSIEQSSAAKQLVIETVVAGIVLPARA
jgi:hypothetical protein